MRSIESQLKFFFELDLIEEDIDAASSVQEEWKHVLVVQRCFCWLRTIAVTLTSADCKPWCMGLHNLTYFTLNFGGNGGKAENACMCLTCCSRC